MAEYSAIEWCDHTFNPWIGCTKVGPGCDHCYAERDFDKRRHVAVWGPGQQRHRTGADTWDMPKRWQRQAAAFQAQHGRRQRVFCTSLADVFDNEVPESWRVDLFTVIEETPDLDWLLLTKRIGNAQHMLPWSACSTPWENVWIGATVVNQTEADRDVPKLLQVPARVRFLSIEPMLGPIDLTRLRTRVHDPILNASVARPLNALAGLDGHKIDWVICGGESGPHARPMHPDWARSLRDQCAAAGVPFLFKQWGEWGPDWEGAATCGACGRTKFDAINSRGECGHCGIDAWNDATKPLDKPRRVGKKAAGRLLDGRTHDEFPA